MNRCIKISSTNSGAFIVRCENLTSVQALTAAHHPGSSKGLPKAQRRGAIVILGMLALANRRVLNDHVDTMLKVGLGPFGKVST